MKIELHLIQNFAPSCLNRDDTNSPKDCVFGGYRRARISSQCIKRAIRSEFRNSQLLPDENLAIRTKRLGDEVARRLTDAGRPADLARIAVDAAITGLGLGIDEKSGGTQYLLYIGEAGIAALTSLCESNWDKLAEIAAKIKAAQDSGDSKKSAKKGKKAANIDIPKDLQEALRKSLDGGKAADLALFGRMLADLPDKNVNAACQVAHAISVNKVDMDMDFFTAVDDLKTTEDDAGAGMMGTVGFNSSCFYRYAVIDCDDLIKNLDGDRELAEKTIEAFLRASVTAIPSGKQNTFAAHNPPDFVMATVRKSGCPVALTNAFVQPAAASFKDNLTMTAVKMLQEYWSKLTTVYPVNGDVIGPYCCGTMKPEGTGWPNNTGSFDELVNQVMSAVRQQEA